jgi:plastocyanin
MSAIRLASGVLAAMLLALLLVACAPDAEEPGVAPGAPAEPTPVEAGEAEVMGERLVVMRATDFEFEPAVLRGNPGQTITVRIINDSGTLHDFALEEQGIREDIPPGQQVEVEVTFPESGSVEFVCTYHVPQGMTGELVVD